MASFTRSITPNNAIVEKPTTGQQGAIAPQPTPTQRWIVFAIAPLQVALPIAQVQRVIRQTEVFSSGLTHLGITHVGDYEVTVVDLYRRLFNRNLTPQPNQPIYQIILRSTQGDLLALPIDSPPELVDVPQTAIRLLPAAYHRQNDTLSIAKQVAVIPTPTGTQTIFLLDTQTLI